MQFKDKELWEKGLENNAQGKINDYSGSVYFFAELWALLMEAEMNKGKRLEDCAKEQSHRACEIMGQYSVTGFQYGAAVSVLSSCWAGGEALRRWHNLDAQIRDEGEKANEKEGAVLNPAPLNIGVNDANQT